MALQTLRRRLSPLFWRWIDRRAPKAKSTTLRHQNIYILPTLPGCGFFLVILLLWLLGTNYENNLVLATSFLLFALMLISIFHAFRNLSGLTLSLVRSQPAFVGEYAEFEILLKAAPGTVHENIHLGWQRELTVETDLIRQQERRLLLSVKAGQRGWLVPERLKVSSDFPLGFMRAWSWVVLDTRALVYPKPIMSDDIPLGYADNQPEGDTRSHDNREDFQGFAVYQPGAPLSQVAWKQYARGAGLYLKDYVGYQSQQVWLDWQAFPGIEPELRLSYLCYWVVTLAQRPGEYGLILPGKKWPLGSGPAHRDQLLRALALYGLTDTVIGYA